MRLGLRASGVHVAYAGAAALAGLVTVAAGSGWFLGGHGPARVGQTGPPLRALATLPSREVFFGDRVDARVEVVVDRSRIHATPLVSARFAPYSIAHLETSHESLGGGYERRITTFTLRCLQRACLPPVSSHRVFRFPQARVTAAGTAAVTAAWPPLVVVSRLYGSPGLRAGALRAPSVVSGRSGRWSLPLLWTSGGLALVGVSLVGAWAVRRRTASVLPSAPAAASSEVDPVLQACALVRTRLASESWARERGALDVLAQTLAAAGAMPLADEASELAWRRERPRDDEVRALLERTLQQRRHERHEAREEAAEEAA